MLELLVAAPLALLLGGAAVQLLTTQLRVARTTTASLRNSRELTQAIHILAAELRPISASDLGQVTDTSLVAHTPVMSGIVCGTPAPNVVDVIDAVAPNALRAARFDTPRAGDFALLPPVDTAVAGDQAAALNGASERLSIAQIQFPVAACAGNRLQQLSNRVPLRIVLASGASQYPALGSLITIARRIEWRSYRAVDGATYLGRRDWDGSSWSTTQPAIGPLLSSANSGLRIVLRRADNSVSTPPDTLLRMVDIALRAPRVRGLPGAAGIDSLTARLTLRGGS